MNTKITRDKTRESPQLSGLASHADVLRGSSRVPVCGAGTCDEPLRTSAWEVTKMGMDFRDLF